MRNVFILGGLLAVLLLLVKRAKDAGAVEQLPVLWDNNPGEVSANADNISGGIVADIRKWAEQIKRFEGGKPGDLNMRNNNPGNLKYTGQAGATGKDSRGFAIFSSEAVGMDALVSDLNAKVRKYPDYSILQIMTRYLGGDVNKPQVTGEGNPFTYAASVAKALGVSIDAKLGDIFA